MCFSAAETNHSVCPGDSTEDPVLHCQPDHPVFPACAGLHLRFHRTSWQRQEDHTCHQCARVPGGAAGITAESECYISYICIIPCY